MNAASLAYVEQWFDTFTSGYLGERDLFPLELKKKHSSSVAADCEGIAEDLGWEAGKVNAAKAAGLLHDSGRFPQFQKYRTFHDGRSCDHGEESWRVIKEAGILCGLPEQEQEEILTAVRYHNRRAEKDGLTQGSLDLLRIVRDADKLDIINIVTMAIEKGWHKEHPAILLEVDINGPVNPVLAREILDTRQGGYENVKSLADMNLMKACWAFGLNFMPSLQRFRDRRYLYGLADASSSCHEVREIHNMVENYFRERLGS
jgi:hypothetical protein